jgi:hypothetical protein
MEINRTAGTSAATGYDSQSSTVRYQSTSGVDYDAQNYQALTASDRDLLEKATGQKITPGGFMPPIANFIAEDRRNGVLTAGQAIDSGYLTKLAERFTNLGAGGGGSSPLSVEILQRASDYLASNGGKAKTDFNA